MFDLTAIVVSYNSHRDIIEALRDLASGDEELRVEVVIVDNASPDGSGAILADRYSGQSNFTVIRSPVNQGFARACNAAAKCAHGRHLLLLNPDARLPLVVIRKAVAIMDADERIGCLGPSLLDEAGNLTFSCRQKWDELYLAQRHILPARIADRLGRRATRRLAEEGQVVDVGWILGACLFVRRDLWLKIGGMDGRFFLSADDSADLCCRARAAGSRTVFVPGLVGLHRGGSTWTNLRRFTAINVYNGHLLFAEKHLGRGSAVRLRVLFLLCSLLKFIASYLCRLLALPVPSDAALAHLDACRWLLVGRTGEINQSMLAPPRRDKGSD